MKIILGFTIFFVGIINAMDHLDQNISQYWDAVAFFMVIMGTLAVAIITMPSLSLKIISTRSLILTSCNVEIWYMSPLTDFLQSL